MKYFTARTDIPSSAYLDSVRCEDILRAVDTAIVRYNRQPVLQKVVTCDRLLAWLNAKGMDLCGSDAKALGKFGRSRNMHSVYRFISETKPIAIFLARASMSHNGQAINLMAVSFPWGVQVNQYLIAKSVDYYKKTGSRKTLADNGKLMVSKALKYSSRIQ